MQFAGRHHTATGGSHPAPSLRCPRCRVEALVLNRRHVSPPQFGAVLTTEYYGCDYCEAEFQFTPETGRWRPIYQ